MSSGRSSLSSYAGTVVGTDRPSSTFGLPTVGVAANSLPSPPARSLSLSRLHRQHWRAASWAAQLPAAAGGATLAARRRRVERVLLQELRTRWQPGPTWRRHCIGRQQWLQARESAAWFAGG